MKKVFNRWVYVCIGILILLLAGLVYAWTVIQAPIAAMYPDWPKTSLSFTFTMIMICFCLGGFLGGILIKKIQARFLLILAAVLLGIGFVISSFAESVIILYLGVGLFSGFGSGFAYNAVISTVGKWFPDKPGLVSGLLLMGFGSGSFIIGKVYTAFTPSDGSSAWRTSFIAFAIVLFVIVAAAGIFIQKPGDDFVPPVSKKEKSKREIFAELSTQKMLKTSQFWLIMIWAILLSAAGVMVVSQGTPLTMEACADLEMGNVATIVGLLSIFNGIGRIIFGGTYDKKGYRFTFIAGEVVFIIGEILILLSILSGSLLLIIIAYIVTGIGYGVIPPVAAAATSQFFGNSHYPVNYSLTTMNLIPASFGSTLAGAIFDGTGSYVTVMIVALAFLVLGTIITFFLKRTKNNT